MVRAIRAPRRGVRAGTEHGPSLEFQAHAGDEAGVVVGKEARGEAAIDRRVIYARINIEMLVEAIVHYEGAVIRGSRKITRLLVGASFSGAVVTP